MRSTTILAAAIAAAYPAYAADATTTSATATSSGSSIQSPSATPTLGVQVSQGCFSSWGNLIFNSTQQYNSRGGCATAICYDGGFLVAAMTAGNECYCGTEYPPKDTVVDDSKCDISCPGYPTEACGGLEFYSVFNTGIQLGVSYAEENATSTTATGTSGTVIASSTVVSGGQTSVVYVTQTPSAVADNNNKKSSVSVGGIVAGVVVGVVALLGIAGGLAFWWRRRVNREIEEEHRRNAAVNAFMKPPGSSGGYSIDGDARLDPVMAQRRLSSGSIADNQDYSRRILRVTNA